MRTLRNIVNTTTPIDKNQPRSLQVSDGSKRPLEKKIIMEKEELYEVCPVCELRHSKLVHNFMPDYEADIIETIKSAFPKWETSKGICARCFDEFEAITLHPYRASAVPLNKFKLKHLDFFILPVWARLNADEAFTGKGVTVCFIDSGFYMHPDFKSRVHIVLDITNETYGEAYFDNVSESAWHGTMTTAVCAGNGSLSKGLYKGLASEANLVLIKTSNDAGKITDENIVKALTWVKENHLKYDVRIVNLSLAGDMEETLNVSAINQLAESLFQQNVLVVAAVGNSLDAKVLPPASSPHVIAVGGVNDNNKLDGDIILYPSSFGLTIDGFSKPDLVSNAIWIPAPMLPGSVLQRKAKVLFQSLEYEDYMQAIIQNNAALLQSEHISLFEGKEKIWHEVKKVFWKEKFITADYMHVDGTSFAAPIVCSVAAQMLQANPALTANSIRQILLSTARPIATYDIARQGHGCMNPKMAVYSVMDREEINFNGDSPEVSHQNGTITFFVQIPCAKIGVSLAGSFNKWKKNEILLKPLKSDVWYVTIPMMAKGRYEYKFYVDNEYWVEDISNTWRVLNGFNAWNNVFEIRY